MFRLGDSLPSGPWTRYLNRNAAAILIFLESLIASTSVLDWTGSYEWSSVSGGGFIDGGCIDGGCFASPAVTEVV